MNRGARSLAASASLLGDRGHLRGVFRGVARGLGDLSAVLARLRRDAALQLRRVCQRVDHRAEGFYRLQRAFR
jgi:hypothetical protein